MPPVSESRLRKVIFWSVLIVALPATAFVLLEGGSSAVLFARDLFSGLGRQMAERLHTAYDPELGWANVPGKHVPDLYGPGKGVRINRQGFRGDREYDSATVGDRRRIICSGDSFTFGYGVGDEATWCAQLENRLPGVETINMGLGGYGIDQAYLWYLRDGVALAHDIHVFAFVEDDFRRMGTEWFLEYGKPRLRLSAGSLQVGNVPVPKPRSPWRSRWTRAITGLRTTALVSRLRAKIGRGGSATSAEAAAAEIWPVARALFLDLASAHRAAGRRLLVVYLPTERDYESDFGRPWRTRVAELAREEGLEFLDLADPLRRLPAEVARAMFIHDADPRLVGANGHYTEAGNEWVAGYIAGALSTPPVP